MGEWQVERKRKEVEVSQQLAFRNNILLVKSQVNHQKCMGALASCREIYAAAEISTLVNLGCSPFPQKYAL